MRHRKSQQLAAGAMAIMLLLSVILLNALDPSLMAAAGPTQAGGPTVSYLA
ncbi:hypothetical protein [Novosphingopyxis sp.]|uniref:hypothetical protein n=1 Tax=Novosphingopyxis sp. TaxID=2709690 RepID=UPI003B59CB4B